MTKEFDKTKIYTPLNITKDLIGAKGYFSDDIRGLKEYINNKNLYFFGEIVDFNDNVIFKDSNVFVDSSGWQFFYLLEMPEEKQEEKQEKWWIVPTYSPFTNMGLFNKFGYCYKVEPQKDSYLRSFPPLKSDFNSKEEAEKWLKEYLETSDELEIDGVLDFSKSKTSMKDFQNEFLRLCEDFNVSFGGSFYELDRNGKRR